LEVIATFPRQVKSPEFLQALGFPFGFGGAQHLPPAHNINDSKESVTCGNKEEFAFLFNIWLH
jgi:hypothetical protein